jgi:hypothetical protein
MRSLGSGGIAPAGVAANAIAIAQAQLDSSRGRKVTG